jgi:hypothetical protein
MNRPVLILLVSVFSASCAMRPAESLGVDVAAPLGWEEVLRLVSSRDYFALRERVEPRAAEAGLPARFARAMVLRAFNDPAGATAVIDSLLFEGVLPDSVASALAESRLANHLRLFDYPAGLAAADELLRDTTGLGPGDLHDIRNLRRLFAALRWVPPQRVEIRGPSTLALDEGRIPVQVGDSLRSYVFDTGANLSTLMRSEAVALGLRILPAGIDVGTSTDQRVVADLAVAERLRIGRIDFSNVVFLVLDDALLTFPGDYRIPGIIGFPVIEGMVEVHSTAAGEIFVPEVAGERTERNLALHELTPLIRASWGETPLLCRLDTGADVTSLYEPAYRKLRDRIEGEAELTAHRWGGAGGIREMQVFMLPRLELALGDTVAVVDSIPVLPTSIARTDAENYLDCNLGQDVLRAFSRFVLNFRDMAFLLH